MNSFIADAVAFLGGASSVARLRKLTPWAVSKWIRDGVPASQTIWLSEQTGWRYTPHQLAPEIYPHPEDGLPSPFRNAVRNGHAAASAPERAA